MRDVIAAQIAGRLRAEAQRARQAFANAGRIRFCIIDDLLEVSLAEAIDSAFPEPSAMMRRQSIREAKFVTAQLDRCDPLVEAAVFAFQDEAVVNAIERITGIAADPDPSLYAGGISTMIQGDFLHPHLDNSHDGSRRHYRALNTLFYVSADLAEAGGGCLELWNDGPKSTPNVIPSRFNRLVIMATDQCSWHSVNRIQHNQRRNCISNYYFTERPVCRTDYFHVTTFRGRPEHTALDALLRLDSAVRGSVRAIFPDGLVKSEHVYEQAHQAIKP
jgi:Rps23 Pro-64 3,4-dihydroxylase Tpa1-like proline 4-hydroxylase